MGLLPQWFKELDFKAFFSGVQRDAVNVVEPVFAVINPVAIPKNTTIKSVFKDIGSGISTAVKTVFSFLTPTLILIAAILILGLIFWKQIVKFLEKKA